MSPPTIKLHDLDRMRSTNFDTLALVPAYRLRERFPITLPDGRVWQGAVYDCVGPHARRRSVRIQVRDQDGAGLFDTDDQFDLANGTNALDRWLEQFLPKPAAV